MSNIFRVNNEDTRMTSGASFVNFEHIAIYSVIIVEFQQIDVVWSCDILVSDNKFVFSNCEKYTVLWAGKIF